MSGGLSRRGLLTGAVATAASSVLASPANAPVSPAGRSLRVAFITDVHLDTNPICVQGFLRCLRRMNALEDRPDLVIQGGDIIMDGLFRPASSVEKQYHFAKDILQRHCSLPTEHVIGNHDIWGWGRLDATSTEADPRFGKRWWLNWTGYTSTYRSFDRGGWHFILLDSIQRDGRGYAARLDEGQAHWLEQDLAQTPSSTPVCIVSHAPIVSAGAMFFDKHEKAGNWHVPRSIMHIDARWLKDLFVRHKNVKSCLSGHIHMADRVDYNGVKHFGVGAVCGAWWRGPMQETPPQFAVVDFYEDGDVRPTYIRC